MPITVRTIEGKTMAEQKAPWSLKQIQRSHEALDRFLTPDVLGALNDGLEEVGGSEPGRIGLEGIFARRGIDLAPGISINYPIGPTPIGPPQIPPIVIGNPQPFRRCLTICHQIGPADPRDPDPTRLTICYILCI